MGSIARSWHRSMAVGLATFALLLTGCGRDDTPTAHVVTVSRAAQDVAALAGAATRARGAEEGALVSSRVQAAKAATAWVGEMHDVYMNEMIRNIPLLRKTDASSRVRTCALMHRLTGDAVRAADARLPNSRTASEQKAVVDRLVRDQPLCAAPASQNMLLGVPKLGASFHSGNASLMVGQTYEDYVGAIGLALQRTDGSTSAVTSYTDAVLASASGLSDEHLYVVAAVASLAVSSAAEWNSFDWSGGGTNCAEYLVPADQCGPLDQSMLTMYRRGWISAMFTAIGADIGGCLASVSSWGAAVALLGGPAAVAIAGSCGYMGALASAGALGILMT